MVKFTVKKGNKAVLEILCKDKDGNVITTLAATSAIKFHVKERKTIATTKISKTKGSGIEVNLPSQGYLRVSLLPAETNALVAGDYYMGCQIEWSATEIYEIDMYIGNYETDILEIVQDIVNT